MAPVQAVKDESDFKQTLQGSVGAVCAFFYAEWSGGKMGLQDLDKIAGDDVKCLSIDVGDDAGEDLALSLGVGSQLPLLRVYQAPELHHLAEHVGDGCTVSAVMSSVQKAKQKAVSTGASDVYDIVRGAYAQTAVGGPGVLPFDVGDIQKRRKLLGYADSDVNESADLGLGCGNPLVAAKLQPGEVVVDLGSGAGIDCFIAAKQVGPTGHVLGVDMTPEMLGKARENAKKDKVENVTFRLGEIEHLPVGDGVVDCLISNCVINLSPDKPQVYREMNRVLKIGGRVSISDVLRMSDIPSELKTAQSYSC